MYIYELSFIINLYFQPLHVYKYPTFCSRTNELQMSCRYYHCEAWRNCAYRRFLWMVRIGMHSWNSHSMIGFRCHRYGDGEGDRSIKLFRYATSLLSVEIFEIFILLLSLTYLPTWSYTDTYSYFRLFTQKSIFQWWNSFSENSNANSKVF